MRNIDPFWFAPRSGQDWKDDELMLAVAWLKSFVPAQEMEQRLERARQHLVRARNKIFQGETAALYDSTDTAAWYILQAETFASDRKYWTPEGVMRVVPFLTRIGKELPLLLSVGGVEQRAARLMLSERQQPDGGLFELLVALAYRRRGWDRVEFVSETPGRGRTPDLHVFRPSKRWAVECKRLMPSPYAFREKSRGEALASLAHALSLQMYSPVVVKIVYKLELTSVPDDYLVAHTRRAIDTRSLHLWDDEFASGHIRPIDWQLARKVLAKDYVYFGGSRMIELLVGQYDHESDHSISAKWRPANDNLSYADTVYHASIVSWRNVSRVAVSKKARHFKSVMSNAEGQLPSDRPGVIHIGVESYSGAQVDFSRHVANLLETRFFSRLLKNSSILLL
jgi:hypothetical protein